VKFLFVGGGAYVSGMERVLLTLMCALRDRGHEVRAVVAGWNDGEYIALLESAKLRALPIKLGRLTRRLPWLLDGLVHYPGAALQLAREARRFHPDVVVHVDVLTAFSALPCLPRKALHIMHVHNVPGHDYRLALGRMTLRRMEGFICVSQFIQGKLVELGSKTLTCVAHNGVEPVGWRQRAASANGTITTFGIVGQVQARKRHSVLLRAVNLLNDSDKARCQVLIVGRNGGEEADRLRKLIRELSLGSKVRWTGHLREKDLIYDGLNVLVAPAVDEPFGATVLEAATYGIPCIAARSGGFPETIVDGQTGILVEPDNPENLARSLSRFINEPSLVAELGDRAKRHVSEHFNAAGFGARFEACVLALAQTAGRQC
jgi:glycosyltransferase involved in cell wall biosynthesis